MEAEPFPKRIVTLTTEATEIVFRLGAADRVVGVSGYSIRPPEARLKPRVAAFTSARLDKIRELSPDLVIAFSDLQKDIVRDLVAEGFTVLCTNQRSLDETLQAILLIGRAIGAEVEAQNLVGELEQTFAVYRERASKFPRRARVYFEEWDSPMISGIAWVGELIELAGGEDIFPELRAGKSAGQRTVDPQEVVRRNPEIIVASWCGKKVNLESIKSRPGWDKIDAVREGRVYEIKSPDILAPGPSLVYGLSQLSGFLEAFHGAGRPA